jgi:hypothetical protein
VPSVLAELAAPGEPCVGTLLENDLFEEGPLYLECHGTSAHGILDRTVVVGQLDPSGGLELRDASTQSVVLRGRLDGPGHVTATLLGEGETRAVRSVVDASDMLPEGRFSYDVLRSAARAVSVATLERRGDFVTGTVNGYGWLTRPPFDRMARGRLRAAELRLAVGGENWKLRVGPHLFVGRAEPGGDVLVLLHPSAALPTEPGPFALPKPLVLGEGCSIVPRAVRHRTSSCEVSLVVPQLKGTAVTPQMNKSLAEEVVGLAMGTAIPTGELPSPEKLRCEPGLGSAADPYPYVMMAGYQAASLGHGWVNLRITGYSRTGGARANVGDTCYLVDIPRGRLFSSAELLDDDQRRTLTEWVERRLRMSARNARLDAEDGEYYRNAAPVTAQTSLCLTADGLEVAFAPGEVTRYVPTRGPSVLIPRRLLSRLVGSGSPLAELAELMTPH